MPPLTDGAVLGLLVRGGSAGLDPLAGIRARRMGGGSRPMPPLVDESRAAELAGGEEEIGAVVVDRTGRVLASQAWPASTRAYHETLDTRRPNGLRVRVIRKRTDHRSLEVAVPGGGEFVVLYASKARRKPAGSPGPKVAIQRRVLKTLYLNRAPGSAVPPVPTIAGLAAAGAVVDVRFQPLAPSSTEVVSHATLRKPPKAYGYLREDVFSLRPRAKPGSKFDVVFIGDGFTEDEQGEFGRTARTLMRGLRRLEPFKSADAGINYHVLYAVSKDSGVSYFERRRKKAGMGVRKAKAKKTYFRFTSDRRGLGEPGFFGTRSIELIRDATAQRITSTWSQVDLIIAIMNCDYPGAAGYPEHRMAVVSRSGGESSASFVQRTAHECGHAIAGFAEEYVTTDRYHPPEWYPNMATERQRVAGTVWWQRLAKRGERARGGGFAVEHLYGEPLKPNSYLVPDLPRAELAKLGLFWGCQCTTGRLGYDPEKGFRGSTEELERALKSARNFYRPMLNCRMRQTKSPFCRVCSHVLKAAVQAAGKGRRFDKTKFGGH